MLHRERAEAVPVEPEWRGHQFTEVEAVEADHRKVLGHGGRVAAPPAPRPRRTALTPGCRPSSRSTASIPAPAPLVDAPTTVYSCRPEADPVLCPKMHRTLDDPPETARIRSPVRLKN